MPRTISACSPQAAALERPNSSSRLARSRSRHRRRNSSTSIGGKGGTSADGVASSKERQAWPYTGPTARPLGVAVLVIAVLDELPEVG